jgi:hypothetical protein
MDDEPRLRNERVAEALAAKTAERMAQVRQPPAALQEAGRRQQTVARGNPVDKAMSLDRYHKQHANDNRALQDAGRRPANDNAKSAPGIAKAGPAQSAPAKAAPARSAPAPSVGRSVGGGGGRGR